MKSFVAIPVIAALVCAAAYSQPPATGYITGQAARLLIGQQTFTDQFPGTTDRLLGAVGGVAVANNMLFMADSNRATGLSPQNRRVVVYNNLSAKFPGPLDKIDAFKSRCPVCTARNENGLPFDNVLGQPDFTHNDQLLSQSGMRLPTAVATDGKYLVVADTENNRILIWNNIPTATNQPADVVLGQDNFTTIHQPIVVDGKSFRGPQGVWIQNGRLYVADTQNHRVLVWNSIPSSNKAADLVLGQPNFNTAVEVDLTKIKQSVHANTLLNPVSVTSDGKRLFVSDLGYSRVLIWNSLPTTNQQPADVVVGQPDMDTQGENTNTQCASNGTDPNNNNAPTYPARCEYTLDFPRFALSDGTRLYVSDTGNDRVLIWNTVPTKNGTPADVVIGQPDFVSDIVTSTEDLFTPNISRSASNVIPAPMGMAWDGQNLYVCDPTDRRILVFSPGAVGTVVKDAVRNAASKNIFALSVVIFANTPNEGDEVTITISYTPPNGTAISADYKYKAIKNDKIEQVIKALTNAINSANNGTGDPYILAGADVPFNAMSLTARQPGDPGFAVTIKSTVSTNAAITATVSKSNPTTQSSQRIAPGTLVSIFGNNLTDGVTAAAPADADPLPVDLGGVQVYFDGIRAPLISVSPTQINTQVPYEVLDTNSITAWVRTTSKDGKTVWNTPAVGVPITQQNPGIFAVEGDEPRLAIAYHGSSNATVTISVDGTVTANDTATITIEDRPYKYTVQGSDTLASIRDALIALINSNDDEKVTAEPAGAFTRIVLRAKLPGQDGIGIAVSTSTNNGANVILTASQGATCCAVKKGALITPDSPALPGEQIIVLATGLGIVTPDAARQGQITGQSYTGPALNDPVSFVSSLAGGRTANVISAGAKPGTIGIYEVVLELNSGIPTDPLTQLTIAQDIYTSNIVTLPVINPTPPTP